MTKVEAEHMAREFGAAANVAMIEHQFAQLTELVAYMTPEQGARILAAVEKYGDARRALIPATLIQPSTDARN